jgi:hypothetical protein
VPLDHPFARFNVPRRETLYEKRSEWWIHSVCFLGARDAADSILVLFVSAIPMILIFIVFVNERPLPADGGFFLQFAGVMVTLQLMGYLVGGMLLGFNNPEKEQKDTRIAFALIGAIFILAFAYIFSGGIYEEIPEGLGGGGLRFEQLSFAKDLDADTITTIQQKFECRQDEKEGVRVGILFADDSYLLIVSRDQSRVLRLDRRYISSELWKHHTISGDTDCDSPKWARTFVR